MKEQELRTFIAAVTRYFERAAHGPPLIDPPFLLDSDSLILEFTGVIGISGNDRGAVYFTAPRGMLAALLTEAGEPEPTADMLADLVGEIANTIAGNARKDFGGAFLISVPIVLHGRPDRITFPRHSRTFVIPLLWREHKAYLIVCLE